MCNIRPEEKISAEKRRTRLELKSMRDCAQDRTLKWFGHSEKIKDSTWSSQCKTFKVRGSLPRKQPRKKRRGNQK